LGGNAPECEPVDLEDHTVLVGAKMSDRLDSIGPADFKDAIPFWYGPPAGCMNRRRCTEAILPVARAARSVLLRGHYSNLPDLGFRAGNS
jgi:hypothetical protein